MRLPERDYARLEADAVPAGGTSHIDADFRRHARSALEAAGEGAGLTPFGRWSAAEVMARMLANAQAIGAYLERHPEVLERPLARPVLVVGWYRSGTTLLHRLLASADGARAPLASELYYPLGTGEAGSGADPVSASDIDRHRHRLTARMLRLAHLAIPSLRQLHRIDADSPEESSVLLDNAGLGIYFLHAFGAHAHGRRLANADLTPAYRSMRAELQLLQHLKGEERRLVLKCPFTIGHLATFLDVFPDASVVLVHRDPVEALSSVCRLSATLQASFCASVDAAAIGTFWRDTHLDAARRVRALRAGLPQGRLVEVDYHELIADPVASVTRLGPHLDLELDRTTLAAALTTTRSDRAPIPHRLADYGLNEAAVRDLFADYIFDRSHA